MKSILQKGILTTSILLLEICWLFLLIYLLNAKGADGRLNVPGLFLIYLLAFGANRLLHWSRWPKVSRIALNIIGWAVFSLLVIKVQMFGPFAFNDMRWLQSVGGAFTSILHGIAPEVVALIGCAILWWFGRRVAYLKMEFSTSIREFQFGLMVILLLLFLAAGFDLELGYAVPAALLFFFAALLSLSLAHAQRNSRPLELYGGNWLGILLMCISVVLILGLIIGSIITPELLRLVAAGFQWLWGMVVKGITFIVNLFPEPHIAADGQIPGATSAPPPEPDYSKFFVLPEVVRTGLRYGWYLLMIGFLLVFLWRISEQFFVWLRERLAFSSNAEFEPLRGAFRADIQALFRRLFSWFGKLRRLWIKRAEPEPKEITSVRQLYRQLLRWAAAGGLPKLAYQTAHEYISVLEEKLPTHSSTLQYITAKYMNTRYGHVTPSADEMERLKNSWQLLKHQRLT